MNKREKRKNDQNRKARLRADLKAAAILSTTVFLRPEEDQALRALVRRLDWPLFSARDQLIRAQSADKSSALLVKTKLDKVLALFAKKPIRYSAQQATISLGEQQLQLEEEASQ